MPFDFPPEVEDTILQWAVFIKPYRSTDVDLALVCKRVQKFIEPILYRTLKFSGKNLRYTRNIHFEKGLIREDNFNIALKNKPPSFFATSVRQVLITRSVSDMFASQLLSVCTGIQHLAYWPNNYRGDVPITVCAAFTSLPLRSLEVDVPTLRAFSTCESDRLLQVAHLAICGRFEKDVVPALGWLPALTHVELTIDRYHNRLVESLYAIVETVPTIQRIIIRPEEFYEWRDECWVQKELDTWEAIDSRIKVEDSGHKIFADLWEGRMQNDRYRSNYISSL